MIADYSAIDLATCQRLIGDLLATVNRTYGDRLAIC